MADLVAPDKQLKALDIKNPNGKKSYVAGKDEKFHVTNPRHVAHMKREGFIEASLMGITKSGIGHDCVNCGFGSWFVVCSRCGHDSREEVKNG